MSLKLAQAMRPQGSITSLLWPPRYSCGSHTRFRLAMLWDRPRSCGSLRLVTNLRSAHSGSLCTLAHSAWSLLQILVWTLLLLGVKKREALTDPPKRHTGDGSGRSRPARSTCTRALPSASALSASHCTGCRRHQAASITRCTPAAASAHGLMDIMLHQREQNLCCSKLSEQQMSTCQSVSSLSCAVTPCRQRSSYRCDTSTTCMYAEDYHQAFPQECEEGSM